MSIFTKKVDEINEQDLQELVDQRFAEWKTVEYKERLSVGTEPERKKFLSQVSSFANAAGGHLIYGVRATDGVPEEVMGMEVANSDGEILKLEDIARTP
jgi:predicted HTH transcriptional regulator